MLTTELQVSRLGLLNMSEELGVEQPRNRLPGLERRDFIEHLAGVSSHYLRWSNLARLLAHIQIVGAAHIDASVGKIHAAFSIVGKAGEKLGAYRDDAV